MVQGPRPDGGEAVCFVLDRVLIRLPLWSSPTGDRIVFDEPLKAFYLVSSGHARVELLTPADSLAARRALMRVVRELAMSDSHRAGRLMVHGAAFVVGSTRHYRWPQKGRQDDLTNACTSPGGSRVRVE